METETLSSYKQIPDKHLVNDSEEENFSKNADELDLPLCETTSDIELEKNADCDNKIEDQDKVSDKGSSGEEDRLCEDNYDKQNVTYESDNEVEEEEEHIPLNIHAEKSDDEDGDEGLDGSEKDDNEATNDDIEDSLNTQDDTLENEAFDGEKDVDKSTTVEENEGEIQKGVENEGIVKENKDEKEKDEENDREDEKNEIEQDDNSTEHSNSKDIEEETEAEAKDEDHIDSSDHTNKEVPDCSENVKNPVEKDDSKDVEMTEDISEKETDKYSTELVEKEGNEKKESAIEVDPLNIEQKENEEKEPNEDPLHVETKEDEEKIWSVVTEDPLNIDSEKAGDKMETDKSDEHKPNDEKSGEHEPNDDKSVESKSNEEKLDDGISNEEKSDEGNSNEPNKIEEMSLLKETLTKNKDDDGPKETDEDDIDMDEDFDPSLLCPDIDMEVDEAPVITSNDTLPPSDNADGTKSPLLYEPIFSTYVDEMTGAEVHFNLAPEEEALRLDTFGEKNPVQFTKIHCTACNVHLGSALDGQGNRFVHPLLKVLICKTCYHFYTSGEFEKDEDGSELYCRWCGQGGQVMCCSNCEMVFCKKCIRINFDRKKLAEIKDVDDWLCFRCDPSQLTLQRIHCAEFMEYVRRETQRASTLENPASYMTVDYTQCCAVQKKKQPPEASASGEPKKKKRKPITVDPDYDPLRDQEVTETTTTTLATTTTTTTSPGYRIIPPAGSTPSTSKVVTVVPRQTDPNKNGGMVQINSNSAFKMGGTTFKPRTGNFMQRPRVQVVGPQAVRAATSSPGYIKILPGGVRVQCNPLPPRQTFTPRQGTTPPRQLTPVRPIRPAMPQPMKHEWFEKTVRAAARVNSNLSYTLTQLNRAQANASSVEALAVVHNKLQEILSTSINSLIQIRKNLRTEFISGIKNIRFPPKPQPAPPPAPSTPTTSTAQDDDVIIVSPPSSPVPPPLVPTATTSAQASAVNVPSPASLARKSPTITTATSSSPSTSQNVNIQPKTFLRVKSLTALQCVPSECITIPDDPPPPPLAPIRQPESVLEKKDDTIEIIDDRDEEPQKNGMVNGLDKVKIEMISGNVVDIDNAARTNNKDTVTPELLKMKSTKVVLVRSAEVEELVKKTHLEKMNGDVNTS